MGRERHGNRDVEGQQRANPPVDYRDLVAGQGRQRGGAHQHRNDGRRRNVARGSGTSSGGWRVAGADNYQVGGASHQERRQGVGETRGLRRRTATYEVAAEERGKRTIQKRKKKKVVNKGYIKV